MMDIQYKKKKGFNILVTSCLKDLRANQRDAIHEESLFFQIALS